MYKKIELKNCDKIYNNKHVGLSKFSLTLPDTGIVMLKGKSGSGKTTFINCVSGLDKFSSGDIFYHGEKIDSLFEYSSFLFQENYFIESLTVFENLQIISDNLNSSIDNLLKELDIYETKDKKVAQLSGGERFRVAFIRAFLQNKNFVFLDEPFANLDKENISIICNVILRHSNEKLFIISSHQDCPLDDFCGLRIMFKEDHSLESFSRSLDSFKERDNKYSFYESKKVRNRNSKFLFAYFKSLLKKDLFKNLFSGLASALSFFTVFTLLSFVCADKTQITYDAFKSNNVQTLTLRRKDFDYKRNTLTIHKNDVEKMSPDYLSYNFFSFGVDSPSGLVYFDEVRVYLDDKFETTLSYPSETMETLEYNGFPINVSHHIFSEKRILSVNKEIYDLIKGNMYLNNEIGVVLDEDSSTSCTVFNDLFVRNSLISNDLIIGILPVDDNEIVIPERLCSYFGYSDEKILNKTISIQFRNSSQYRGIEENFQTKSMKVVGVSRDKIFFNKKMTFSYLEMFGFNSLENSDISMTIFNYNFNTFKDAEKCNLMPVGEISDKILNAFEFIDAIIPFLLTAAVILFAGSIFTIISNLTTAFSKSKKDIGILICFMENKRTVSLPYIVEESLILIISSLVSIPFSLLVSKFINDAFSKNFLLKIKVTSFQPYVFAALLAVLLLTVLIISFVVVLKIKQKKKIDVLKENA